MGEENLRYRDNEPVRVGYLIQMVVQTLLLMLVSWGVLEASQDQLNATMAFVIAFIGLVTVLVPLFVGEKLVRKKTTPVANPKDNDGRRLTPEE